MLKHRVLGIFAAGLLVTAAALPAMAQDAEADLDAIKEYLLGKTTELTDATSELETIASQYYDVVEESDFDYESLVENPEIIGLLLAAREAWMVAAPAYEEMEGIVAGVPTLAEYDVTLDAGVSGEEDPVEGVTYDLELLDGRVFERPGNLFGVTEGTLWGTIPDYSSGVWVDLDANGEQDFAELLPDAAVLLAGAETLNSVSEELAASAEEWEPTESDAFTALVVMVPTMSEYFGSWKESRFVAGDDATRTDFVAISRLSDIQDILGGLQVVYASVSPLVATESTDFDSAIDEGLSDLYAYVADLYTEEQDGRVFTAEEADFFGSEAQDRADTITGQIAQVAALLNIELAE